MSAPDEPDELNGLQSELAASKEEARRLRAAAAEDWATIGNLEESARRDASAIRALREDAGKTERIARAQRALIGRLRAEVGDAAHEVADVGERLHAAEDELVDLRAIRDALASPALVQRNGMTIAGEVIPAALHVGGDFFFVGDGPGETAVIAVGDVVGKGLAAARRAAFTRTALASVAAFSDDPCQLLRWVNVALVERIGESADFVTAACLTYDPSTRVLRYVSAGHHPALRLDSGMELVSTRGGVALGLSRELTCAACIQQLERGEGVLLFTDGFIEARCDKDRYGTERLVATLQNGPHLSPRETIELLKRKLHAYAGERFSDDVCLLAMRTA